MTSNAVRPTWVAGLTSSLFFGRCFSRFCKATSTWCLIPDELFAACAISALPLGLSAWSTWWSAAGAAKAIATAITPSSAR